ncbi:hypothetical protein BG015_006529 [Linnemannia schmuckeri]|uniref:NodB homology domain-containing protein n=1 Tax=Linnemannia schmuckeri TaxID=64567 RepID=A0A9P5S016_9FUNG|nr:hypothetical protein BG015_006529 [Linnemannia schmuckeri]
MKFTALLVSSALFLATMTTAQVPAYEAARVSKCKMPGVVAYTFDDGPYLYNDQLLEILKKKNVVATFYLVGQMVNKTLQQQGSLKKMLEHGHQLASHTYTHSNLDLMTEAEMKSEISRTSDVMFANSGVRPRYMRAPEGRCADACTKVMKELGLVISYWNVDTNDWRHVGEKTPALAVQKSMEELNKVIVQDSNPATDSFILLQHEIHQFSVEHLADVVIDAILKKGYRFVSMEECIGEPAYLEGSVVPTPSTNPVAPTATVSGSPTSTTGAGAGAGSGNGGVTVPTTSAAKSDNGAGIKAAAGWSLGLTAAASALGLALF